MNEKMKACFKPHVIMHSLVGLGIGVLLGRIMFIMDNAVVIGSAAIVVGVVFDLMRKS